ncbi:hypothetical protein DAEQUDRAFT_129496 [Daedalea quercina L-15889]|uniref:Uncharacterized protein n=1 Tax=Daedalea quercina L-15889 TaxID=1314783 RepID=A0A165S192_9APHY|nr:hypothetical protein DAEQUDRAFT_129496 [Daedalea quercina L-15889]
MAVAVIRCGHVHLRLGGGERLRHRERVLGARRGGRRRRQPLRVAVRRGGRGRRRRRRREGFLLDGHGHGHGRGREQRRPLAVRPLEDALEPVRRRRRRRRLGLGRSGRGRGRPHGLLLHDDLEHGRRRAHVFQPREPLVEVSRVREQPVCKNASGDFFLARTGGQAGHAPLLRLWGRQLDLGVLLREPVIDAREHLGHHELQMSISATTVKRGEGGGYLRCRYAPRLQSPRGTARAPCAA